MPLLNRRVRQRLQLRTTTNPPKLSDPSFVSVKPVSAGVLQSTGYLARLPFLGEHTRKLPSSPIYTRNETNKKQDMKSRRNGRGGRFSCGSDYCRCFTGSCHCFPFSSTPPTQRPVLPTAWLRSSDCALFLLETPRTGPIETPFLRLRRSTKILRTTRTVTKSFSATPRLHRLQTPTRKTRSISKPTEPDTLKRSPGA